MNKKLFMALTASLLSTSVLAVEPFVVSDIRVEGIQRTEAGTVFNYLPVKVGDTFTDEKGSEALKALYATGFFKDVRIESEGTVLVVFVDERPAIAQIDFVGMKEFEPDQIKKGLKDVGFSESRIFDRAVLDKAEQELKRQYLARGKYAVQIKTTVTPLERNRVGINFDINEGSVAKIREINIVGAKAFSEKTLTSLFVQQTPSWTTWYTKNDQYSKQKLAADLETLQSYYFDHGYLEFTVESTQVTISPDKNDIFITVNINEGKRFIISSVKLAGDLTLSEDEFRKLVKIKPGEIFSRKLLIESTKAISDRLGEEGYAFANVNASPEINKEKQQVAFTIFVDPGRRTYVNRINISGNSRTRDEVIRREFRQMEGAWFDAEKVKLSRERVDKLGYFQEVTVETPAVPGTTDQVDVNLRVEERPTGNLSLGIGGDRSNGVVFSGGFAQDNLFGSGKNLAVNLNTAKTNRNISLSYTNPYFTIDGISQGFNVYHRTLDASHYDVSNYKTTSTGGGINFGYPISERQTIVFGMAVDSTKLEINQNNKQSPKRYVDFVAENGSTNLSIPLTVSWTKDSKDSFIYPTEGTMQRLGLEVAVPGGDLQYYRASYLVQHFMPLSSSLTLMGGLDLGYADGYSNSTLPFYKNYYVGGINSLRGYATGGIGPRDYNADGTVSNDHTGGNAKAVGTVELLFPMPGMGQDKSFRLSTFVDIGQLWTNADNVYKGDSGLRYSAGLALAWTSPLGPLKFSIAQPLNKGDGDKVENFQFQLGTTF